MNKKAWSKVKTFNLIDNGNSSYVQFGDYRNINANYRGLAVQQLTKKVTTKAGEPMFEQYSIFQRQYNNNVYLNFPYIPVKLIKPDYTLLHDEDEIEKHIEHLNITISSTSSTILIGNGHRRYAESRRKNIRQHL